MHFCTRRSSKEFAQIRPMIEKQERRAKREEAVKLFNSVAVSLRVSVAPLRGGQSAACGRRCCRRRCRRRRRRSSLSSSSLFSLSLSLLLARSRCRGSSPRRVWESTRRIGAHHPPPPPPFKILEEAGWGRPPRAFFSIIKGARVGDEKTQKCFYCL